MTTYIEGDLLEGNDSDIVGRVARQLRARAGGRVYTRPPLPATPAQATLAELRSYLGFGNLVFSASTGTTQTVEVEPQESFRGERLIVDTLYFQGTDPIATAPLATINRIDIGTQPQSPSVQFGAPAAMFRADSTYSQLDLQVAYRGTKIAVVVGISRALTGTGTLTVSMGMFGQWIR